MPGFELSVHPLSLPLTQTFATAVRSAATLHTVIVTLRDQSGHLGYGEIPLSKVTGVDANKAIAILEGPLGATLRSALNVADAFEVVARSDAPAPILSGLDCALWDLRAQQQAIPLWQLLGARPSPIYTDMTISVDTAQVNIAKAAELAEKGFNCIKVKIDDRPGTVDMLQGVRREVGESITLRVDANQALTVDQAVRLINGCDDAGVNLELVEQPVLARDIAGLAQVNMQVDTPVMADEAVWTLTDLSEVIERGAAGMVNLKLAKTGGITEALTMRDVALEAGLSVFIGCMLESEIGLGAAACLAASVRDRALGSSAGQHGAPSRYQDLDGGLWLAESPVRGGIRYEGQRVELPTQPGLGIEAVAGVSM